MPGTSTCDDKNCESDYVASPAFLDRGPVVREQGSDFRHGLPGTCKSPESSRPPRRPPVETNPGWIFGCTIDTASHPPGQVVVSCGMLCVCGHPLDYYLQQHFRELESGLRCCYLPGGISYLVRVGGAQGSKSSTYLGKGSKYLAELISCG